jgi:hypothetical protein
MNTTAFVPSTQWQDIPDWAVLPNGGEYQMDFITGVNQVRWNPPVPPASAVLDKRTLPGGNGQCPPPPVTSNQQAPPPPVNPGYVAGVPSERDKLKKILTPLDVLNLPDQAPLQLIEGILYQGGKLSISSGSKSYKTWNLFHLLFCIANGLPYLGFKTPGVPILIFDFELMGFDCRYRLEQIAKCYPQITNPFKNIRIVPLRGRFISFGQELVQEVAAEVIMESKAKAFALAPIYKALGEHDENLSKDIAQVLLPFEQLTVDCNVSFLYEQHFSKGDQSLKDALDRIGGSGTFARDPDSILIFTAHKEPGCFTVEMVLRSFKEVEPFVVRWKHPLFIRESSLDPDDLKTPKRRRGSAQEQSDCEKIMAALQGAEASGGLPYTRLLRATKIKETTFRRRLKTLETNDEIFFSKLACAYQLSPKSAQKWNQTP